MLTACGNPVTKIDDPPTPAQTTQASSNQPVNSPVPTPTEQITPPTTPSPEPPSRPKYELDAVLNYDLHLLKALETIHYTNRSGDTLAELVLMVDPLYYPGTFTLDSLEFENGQAVTGVTMEKGQIRFPLPQALAPGETIVLKLAYQLNLPSPVPAADTRPIPFGYTTRQTNLVDWYPFIAPYISGQGWLAHPAGYYGEHLVYEMADFEVAITIDGDRKDLVVAASAPATREEAEKRSFYRHENARNFAWSVSPFYITQNAQAGDVSVTSYAFPTEKNASQAVLQATIDALNLYDRLFGPYPRQHLAVVEADFLDGMEYDGLYFLSKGFYNLYTGTPGEYLIAIAAHETAHQWWYAQVGNDQALEPWLDEALCTYIERLFYENVHPESLEWWWTYRVDYFEPSGWIDDSIYNPHGATEAYRSYLNAVYLNGAHFFEDLRKLVGDANFFSFLQDYLQQTQSQITTADQFFSILKTHTQADLAPLVEKYFYNK
jgi:hypothetical protein